MNIKEYAKTLINKPSPNLEAVYEELIRLGHHPQEIYRTINEIVVENIDKIIRNHLNKNEE
jgi:DNA helicase IV